MAERASTRPFSMDLFGVSTTPLFSFYPASFNQVAIVTAVPRVLLNERRPLRLVFQDASRPECEGYIDIAASLVPAAQHSETPPLRLQGRPSGTYDVNYLVPDVASHALMCLPGPSLSVNKPGQVHVYLATAPTRTLLTNLQCGFVRQAELSEDERNRLLADELSDPAVALHVECQKCHSEVRLWESLRAKGTTRQKIEQPALRISDMDADWICKCGHVIVDVALLRQSLPMMFRQLIYVPRGGRLEYDAATMYDRRRLAALCQTYAAILEKNGVEEEIHSFIADNRDSFWAFLAPQRILNKPPVLARKAADFAVITLHRRLYLVELEKPSTPLFRKDGGRTSELQRGFTQIDEWRQIIRQHRAAFLHQLPASPSDVLDIHFILVAGRFDPRQGTYLGTMRDSLPADVTFYTYDDLGAFLYQMESHLGRL